MPIIRSLLLLLALCWFGTGEAKAACTLIGGNPSSGYNNGDWACDDEGEAYMKVASMGVPSMYASCGMINVRVEKAGPFTYSKRMTYPGNTCGIGYQQDIGTGSANFPGNNTCSSRQDYVGKPPQSTHLPFPVPGSLSCLYNCTVGWYNNGDGTWTGAHSSSSTGCTHENLRQNCALLGEGWFWNAYAGVCQPPTSKCSDNEYLDPVTGTCGEACPAGMILDNNGACTNPTNECPAGNIKAPSGECLPGDGQCAAGEARTSQGTCGSDTDGDGVPDVDDPDIDGDGIPNEEDPDQDGDGNDETPEEKERDKREASGGDSCAAPPTCSGDAIQCMQVKIQWRIDCNTRKNRNISGGTCSAVPVCTGDKCDAIEYASLIQQWKAACALEKLAALGDSGGGGDGDAVVDLLTGPGSINSNAGGGDSLEDGNPWADEVEEYEPDASGYGWSRACPSPPSFTLPGGQSVQIDLTPLCNWVSLGGMLVLILAGLMSLRIVAGGAA